MRYKDHVKDVLRHIASEDTQSADLLHNAMEIGGGLKGLEGALQGTGIKYSAVCKQSFTRYDHKTKSQKPYGVNWLVNRRAIYDGWNHIQVAQQDGSFPYECSVNVAKCASWVRDNFLEPERKAKRDAKAAERKAKAEVLEGTQDDIIDAGNARIASLSSQVGDLKGELNIARQTIRDERMRREAAEEALAKLKGAKPIPTKPVSTGLTVLSEPKSKKGKSTPKATKAAKKNTCSWQRGDALIIRDGSEQFLSTVDQAWFCAEKIYWLQEGGDDKDFVDSKGRPIDAGLVLDGFVDDHRNDPVKMEVSEMLEDWYSINSQCLEWARVRLQEKINDRVAADRRTEQAIPESSDNYDPKTHTIRKEAV